jgi:RNA polymerase sigma factor (sigma-70 family)
MSLNLNNPELVALVRRVAHSTSSSFPAYVTSDDVEQDIWLWVLKNKASVSRVIRDNESWPAMLYSTMAKVAHSSAMTEEAATNRYSLDDTYEYSTKVIKTLLESVFDYEDWQPSPGPGNGMPKAKGQANETGDRTAMLADVNRAVVGLPDDQYNLIIWHYKYHKSFPELASILEVTENAARLRLNRAVEAIRRALGKKTPSEMREDFLRRSVTSNASANYHNQRNYEG